MSKDREFIDSIDCCFPYNQKKKAYNLIREALLLSSESVFAVLHELARLPRGEMVSKEKLFEMVEYINKYFTHWLKNTIIEVVKTTIRGQDVECAKILTILNEFKKYPYNSMAINIVYFSCDDTDWKVDKKYNEIIEWWNINK